MKALVVDDQASIRGLLKMVVSKVGFNQVYEAADGGEAVDVFLAEKPDLILMDINMPKVTGVEALKQIMAADEEAVVVMLTSQDTAQVVRGCIEAGAAHFLLKNNPPEVLHEEIAALVREMYE